MLIILGMSFTIVGIAKIEVKDYIHFIKIPFTFLVISIIMILINFSGDKSVLLHYIKVGNLYIGVSHIDLIICDIMMPNMDGYEFTETLRDGHCETPIIIVTAKEQLEDKKKGFSIGADDYMVKPIDFEGLNRYNGFEIKV